jgi:hypothetical protein
VPNTNRKKSQRPRLRIFAKSDSEMRLLEASRASSRVEMGTRPYPCGSTRIPLPDRASDMAIRFLVRDGIRSPFGSYAAGIK